MKTRTTFLFAAAAMWFFVGLGALSLRAADAAFSCLEEFDGPRITIQPTDQYVALDFHGLDAESRIDGNGAILRQLASRNKYPVDIRSRTSACGSGISVYGDDDLLLRWGERYGFGNHGSVIGRGGHLHYERIRIFNGWDGLRVERRDYGGQEFTIENVWLTYNRDDCVENDNKWSGTVRDSLFDGCYVGFSATGTGSDGTADVVRIEDSIIRMQRMPGPNGHRGKDANGVPTVIGHEKLFKWGSNSPQIELKNVIIYWEWIATTKYGESNWTSKAFGNMGFRVAQNQLKSCENVTIIWPKEAQQRYGDFPGDVPTDCVTITDDVGVYERARAEWIAAHPDLIRLPNDPFTIELDSSRVPQIVELDLGGTQPPEPGPEPEPCRDCQNCPDPVVCPVPAPLIWSWPATNDDGTAGTFKLEFVPDP